MNPKILKILNPILLLTVIFTLVGVVGYNITELEPWRQLHFISGALFFLAAILHLILNWGWVKASYLKRKKAGK